VRVFSIRARLSSMCARGSRCRKAAELDSFDDPEVKLANIGLHISRRPILAFGIPMAT
jgi:hypothetical protein